eukprot:TRINITY_DN45520_c1_g1_i1.p1 TRINITY_DN45520_c1_g1~~TRINITY_DN45520_c1_g1_i1.p1  ORF type:complete len:1050 (+),score=294.57 TRINITY_DN45520_c1_g1_i1:121-3270(+)
MPVEKQIPWCTIILCGGAAICHTLVMMGNMKTAGSFNDMGKSVGGWSKVGLAVSESLNSELDSLLGNVTEQLTDAINQTLNTQELIDQMLSMMGGVGMQAAASGAKHAALLQVNGEEVGDPMETVMKFVMKALQALPSFQNGLKGMQGMMTSIKPALLQTGVWVETFADQVQATVENFGTTLDRAQKMFDQVMMKVSPSAGEGADVMLHETFNLFDVDGSGAVSEEDLLATADLYAINALKGEKAKELMAKYDENGDEDLSLEELALLVEDPSITAIMATVLRAYAKRLSMVAGNVAAARMRDEVARSVVKYFQLVCSKNITKVGWVSDMLTNGTLPIEFTADIMAELALLKDDPDILTTADVGEIVVGKMMNLDQEYTMKAFDLMSDPEHWEKEGFEAEDQPGAISTVTGWTQTGPDVAKALEEKMITKSRRTRAAASAVALLETDVDFEATEEDDGPQAALASKGAAAPRLADVQAAMPAAAHRLALERMKKHVRMRRKERMDKRRQLFDTPQKRVFLEQLLRGTAAMDGGALDRARQAMSRGVPAKPETLAFASWLSANASATADRFQDNCFTYTGQSSGPLDAFNTQIQGMVKKLSGFIDIMKEYATPYGIEKMENLVNDFAANAMKDVFAIVQKQIVDALKGGGASAQSVALARQAIGGAAGGADGEAASATQVSLLELLHGNAASASHAHGLHENATVLLDLSAWDSEAGSSHGMFESISLLEVAGPSPQDRQRLRDMQEQLLGGKATLRVKVSELKRLSQAPDVSGIWVQATDMLRQLQKVLPTAIEIMKFARTEVSAVSANLDSIFSGLSEKGVGIFVQVASLYSTIWFAYYVFVMTLTLGLMWYGFWASGWFGGPKPMDVGEDEDYQPPQGFVERLKCCCSACLNCMARCHDREACFWCCILIYQLILLVLLLMSIVFVILAAVQIFVGSACGQVYLLGDEKVCTDTLNQVATFMSTFQLSGGEVPLSMSCNHFNLQVCDLVKNKMLSSAMLTVVGSFVSTVLSFEMMFEIAIIHERARWRRVINEIEAGKGEGRGEKVA